MSSLAHDLHRLVRALDRSAEARLAPFGITYARYLALVIVEAADGLTQRELAGQVGQSEATASRTVTVLAQAGWLDVRRTPGDGNRRSLHLTPAGQQLLDRAGHRLGSDFDEVVRGVGADPDAMAADVRRFAAIVEAAA